MVRDFFRFQRSDRLVICGLLVVAALACLLVVLVGKGTTTTTVANNDSTLTKTAHSNGGKMAYAVGEDNAAHERFAFDPNTADSTTLLRLGLQPWQVRSVYRYRAKGGVYRTPTDFARLYGLTKKQFRELEPYIRIGDDYQPAASLAQERYYDRWNGPEPAGKTADKPAFERQKKIAEGQYVALNSADTTVLKTVPGIGSYFARRIVSYRGRLGGYSSVNQLMEIEGFPEDALSYFTVSSAEIQRINVNKATLNQLTHHPYISFYQARSIVDYRRMRGPLKSLQDLRLLKNFDDKTIQRIEPYVSF